MSLFQKSVINKYLKTLDENSVQQAYHKFKNFYGDKQRLENIKLLKEENYQEGFLREIFVQVLGYTINPDKDYNLTTEFKNQTDARKADGAILKDNTAIGVIELKSTKIKDLESIKEQAFSYKHHQINCRYIITSNFEKLRFYIDNATEFEEFNLFNLNEDDFKILYLFLSKESIFTDIPQKLKEESKLHEENISDKLYQDYSRFKQKIFENLTKNNPQFDKLILFKKSQKLLDRFLFVLFAEDSGLLPPNAMTKIIDQWKQLKELDEPVTLYSRFVKFFYHLYVGHKYKNYELYPYNGGLFEKDEILDNAVIDDEILLQDTLKLSTYNFQTDVDVNILGHIFEHSISEIEEFTTELEGNVVDKKKSKRKKEGIFYTPKYITKYIVDNTVGALCDQKKQELNLKDIDPTILQNSRTSAGKLNRKAKDLLHRLNLYRDYLISLKILDPACGSGAFLNQALEFLIYEHQFIDEQRRTLEQDSLGLHDVERSILENNLYGVDINEESVEIAKLSLWLRTAEKGRKLSDLNNNIKCGNSLIDDESVAGEKAFKWEDEFPVIMKNGGFDVVIGNPPYGAKISRNEITFLVSKQGNEGLSNVFSDTYIAFYIQSLKELLKEGGLLGFIAPNTWRLVLSGNEFRDFLSKGDYIFQEIIQHQEKVFADATVDCDTVIIKKQKLNNHIFKIEIKNYFDSDLSHYISQNTLAKQDFFNLFLTEKIYELKQKIEERSVFVNDCLIIKNGVKPYEKGKGKPQQTAITMEEKPFTSVTKMDDSFSPLIGGSSFHRYKLFWNNDYWIKYGEWLAAPRDREIFLAPEKLIFRQTGDSIIGTFVNDKFIMRDNTHILLSQSNEFNLKYILSVLNSKLSNFIYWTINPEKGEALAQVKLFHLGLLCFPKISNESQQPFVEKADKMLVLNKQVQEKKNKFFNRVKDNFEIAKISNKLESFYEFDFKSFLTEIKKQKIKLLLVQQDEWEEYFNNYKTELLNIQEKVNKTDNEIDQMVYNLYNLSDEEIKIVEGNI
jgi:SAM-dependent methyltransferase